MIKIIFKSFIRPHLEYAIPVWRPYYNKDIKMIESVQRRASRLVPELKRLHYDERLLHLNLTKMVFRHERGDLIQMFKIVNSYESISIPVSIIENSCSDCPSHNTRSHKLKIKLETIRCCRPREKYFINRIGSIWNGLPGDIVNEKTTNGFKAKLDDFMFKRHYGFSNKKAALAMILHDL